VLARSLRSILRTAWSAAVPRNAPPARQTRTRHHHQRCNLTCSAGSITEIDAESSVVSNSATKCSACRSGTYMVSSTVLLAVPTQSPRSMLGQAWPRSVPRHVRCVTNAPHSRAAIPARQAPSPAQWTSTVDWGHQCRVTGATSRHARLSSTAITSTVAYALCQADSETNTTAFESMPCRTGTTHTGSIIVSRLLRRLPMHVCGFADGTCTYSGIITVCRLLRRIMMNVCRFATGCTRCGAGRYSPGSTVACADCAAGQQHGSAEQSSCWICHAGSVTDTLTGSGAVSCVACVANQYSAVVTFAGRIVCVGLRDRHLERLRCCELHGMHGGSVQCSVDVSVHVSLR
jgi:hypothetical protein